MATRQRLRAILDARRASRPCWRCAFDLPCYSSTSAIDGTATSKDNRETMQQGELKSEPPIHYIHSFPALIQRFRYGDEFRLRKIIHKPRIRKAPDGRPEVTAQLPEVPYNSKRDYSDSSAISSRRLSGGRRGQLIYRPRIREALDDQPEVIAQLPEEVSYKSKRDDSNSSGRLRTSEGRPISQPLAIDAGKGSAVENVVGHHVEAETVSPARTHGTRSEEGIDTGKPSNDNRDGAPRIKRWRLIHSQRGENNLQAAVDLHSIRKHKQKANEIHYRKKDWKKRRMMAMRMQLMNAHPEDFRAKWLGARVTNPEEQKKQQDTGRTDNLDIMGSVHQVDNASGLVRRHLARPAPRRVLTAHPNALPVRAVQTLPAPRQVLTTTMRKFVAKQGFRAHPNDLPVRRDELHVREHQRPLVRQVPFTGVSTVLTSMLDEFSDRLPPALKSSTRSSPQYPKPPSRYMCSSAQPSGSGSSWWSRTPNRRSNSFLSEINSTATPTVGSRPYATVASQTLQANSPIDQTDTGTSPDGASKETTGGVREALRLWKEQHDIASAKTLGRNPATALSDSQNLLTQSGEDDSFTSISRDDELDEGDDVDIDFDDPIPDMFAHQVFLRRGDLVELKAGTEVFLAIFVRYVADQCQFYTHRGEWVNREVIAARWAVSRFVDPSDLNDILQYLPDEEVSEEEMYCLHPLGAHAPRNAGAKLIKQMSLFHQAADAAFRAHAERIDRIYDIIAPTEGDSIYMSLKDIAMKVLMIEDPSELTQPLMWTIHKAVSSSQNIQWITMNSRQNPIYEILPRQGLKFIYLVREWVREFQENITQETTNQVIASRQPTSTGSTSSLNPIAAFVQKARSAIQQSRQTRPLSITGSIGPSLARLSIDENTFREIRLSEFDDYDKIILHYLDVWATSSSLNSGTNLSSLGPMILRAVGMYEGFELDRSTGFTLLQELGFMTPWANRTVFRGRGLKLVGFQSDSSATSQHSDEIREELRNQISAPKDSMEGLRRDWSEMPVFCIDSAHTLERDDGVSLELIDDDSSTYWVHIHVANPSAFITPDSAIAKNAASIGQSVYFPEWKQPMLDPTMTTDRFSLASDRPCITFSAKVSADGDTLEKKITPGIVRNVHSYTQEAVARGLGLIETDEESITMSSLTVGGHIPTEPTEGPDRASQALTDPKYIKVLQKLLELGKASYRKRIQNGAPDFVSDANRKTVFPVVYAAKSAGKLPLIDNRAVRQFEGDPIISLQRRTEGYNDVSRMVANLMIIAGDVCASWCSDRNVPIPYRGIIRNPEPPSSPEDFKRLVLDPKIAKYGQAETTDLRRYMRLVGQVQASDRPMPHITLGLPAYSKVTSPLRRYVDLYAHWQVEAAIRHEAITGTSLIGRTDSDSHLPFSRAQVAEFAADIFNRERIIAHAQTSSTQHWVCQALFRAFYFDEAPLPKTCQVRVMSGYAGLGFCWGWWYEFGVKARLRYCEAVTKEGGCFVGDTWKAKLEKVQPYHVWIQMEPTRLLTRESVEGKEV